MVIFKSNKRPAQAAVVSILSATSMSIFAAGQLFCAPAALAQKSETVKPGENLVIENIPPIPNALAEEVDKYTNARSAAITGWHPKKREMLISTRFAETQQVHLVKIPGGARTQLTFSGATTTGAAYQPTDGRYFVYNRDKGGDEFYQKYRFDTASKQISLLTDGKSRNTGAAWSRAGNQIAYGSTRRNGNDVDIYVIDPSDPKSDHLIAQLSGGGWQALDWSVDDKTLLLQEELSINDSALWSLDLKSGEKKRLTPKNEKEEVVYAEGVYSKDGKGIYLKTDKDAENNLLSYMNLQTGEITCLTPNSKYDVEEIALSWDGNQLAYTTNEEGKSLFHLRTVNGRVPVKVNLTVQNHRASATDAEDLDFDLPFDFPAGMIHDLKWHQNNKDLGFVANSARSPGDVYTLDTKSKKIERWTESETGSIDTSAFEEPELIHWKSFDGKDISGFLYKPPAKFSGKRPVIINIHGGPEGQSRPGYLGRSNYFLNELGIAIIYPNIRGSAGYGKTYLKLDNGKLREDSYKDIGALFDHIATRPDLDAGRVMVMGGSYGGHMTLAVSTNYADKIRCAIDVVGPSNLVTFLENTQGYRRDLRRVEYGDERDPDMRAFLNKIAPSNNADKITKPLFVVQGKNDPRVPASESTQMVAAVRKNGTPVWFLMANDEGHGFAKKKNMDFLFYSEVLFMQKYLLN